jgi:ATP-dependent Clp protease adaptor protein ClpS
MSWEFEGIVEGRAEAWGAAIGAEGAPSSSRRGKSGFCACLLAASSAHRSAAGPGGGGNEGGGDDGNKGGVPLDDRETDLATRTRKKSARPDRYKVLLHNDDYTPMDFVVAILVQVFDKSPAAATQIMLAVHNAGMGVAGVYVLELAETKVAKVHKLAEERGYPLRAGVEKE